MTYFVKGHNKQLTFMPIWGNKKVSLQVVKLAHLAFAYSVRGGEFDSQWRHILCSHEKMSFLIKTQFSLARN